MWRHFVVNNRKLECRIYKCKREWIAVLSSRDHALEVSHKHGYTLGVGQASVYYDSKRKTMIFGKRPPSQRITSGECANSPGCRKHGNKDCPKKLCLDCCVAGGYAGNCLAHKYSKRENESELSSGSMTHSDYNTNFITPLDPVFGVQRIHHSFDNVSSEKSSTDHLPSEDWFTPRKNGFHNNGSFVVRSLRGSAKVSSKYPSIRSDVLRNRPPPDENEEMWSETKFTPRLRPRPPRRGARRLLREARSRNSEPPLISRYSAHELKELRPHADRLLDFEEQVVVGQLLVGLKTNIDDDEPMGVW